MEVNVVVGANYGDEGKGLVSGSLARKAYEENKKSLTVFYNGTSQRAHTFEKQVFRSIAGGSLYGSDTYYNDDFVVDPISLWISGAVPIIHPGCRVILPCDVVRNRAIERARGKERHGSCGFGLYECVKRSKNPEQTVYVSDLMELNGYKLYKKLKDIEKIYGEFDDELYNMEHLMMAIDKMKTTIKTSDLISLADNYDVVIFEGGQGLMLDQNNKDDFPYLTPSSTGNSNIRFDVGNLGGRPNIYYVTRSYITRHGAGPMEAECTKDDINPDIVDKTNQPNEFQGDLRFGKINLKSLQRRIKDDLSWYAPAHRRVNLVVTQTNYTQGNIFTTDGLQDIDVLKNMEGININQLWASDQEDYMERVM